MLGGGRGGSAGIKRQISCKLDKAGKDISKALPALIFAKAGNFLLST
jgi:hypothetical protein